MKRLLLIDDADYHNAEFMEALKLVGDYEITLNTSQSQYKTDISLREYDIALLYNLKVPGRGKTDKEPWRAGIEILADLGHRGLPVLVLSTEPREVDAQIRDLGAKVLRKPAVLGAILEELRQLQN